MGNCCTSSTVEVSHEIRLATSTSQNDVKFTNRPELKVQRQANWQKKQYCDTDTTCLLLEVITNLESQKGRPVYLVEILQGLQAMEGSVEQLRDPRIDLFNMFKDDRIFCDAEMNLHSVNE